MDLVVIMVTSLLLDTTRNFAYNKHLPSLVAQSAERAAVNR